VSIVSCKMLWTWNLYEIGYSAILRSIKNFLDFIYFFQINPLLHCCQESSICLFFYSNDEA